MPCFDCFSSVASLAAHARLRLGTYVAVIRYRHPVLTATVATIIDVLSGRRLKLGAGNGHRPVKARRWAPTTAPECR
jgi:alkanesulfonate monooxygenase SsuD/methylene tetrahydromethanopterin reductase-like flavin-dependent oxidoreductase (luciferase family)